MKSATVPCGSRTSGRVSGASALKRRLSGTSAIIFPESSADSQNSKPMQDLEELRERLRTFAKERDWEQFHSPKNLAMALSVEAAELLERFQWLTETQSKELRARDRTAVADEIADVMIYLTLLADNLGINLLVESHKKITKNGRRYPVALAKGRATKASDLRARRKVRS